MKVRYIIHKHNNLYIAQTLEYGLACQSHSLYECDVKIKEQIEFYRHEIHYSYKDPVEMMSRKASWYVYLLYYTAYLTPIINQYGKFYLERFHFNA